MAGICDTCHAGCCRSYHLVITAFDALMIAKDLGLPVAEFTTFFTVKGEVNESNWGKNSTIKFGDPKLVGSNFAIGLKKVESALNPGTTKCYFLQEWLLQEPIIARGDHPGARIAARCGIYHSRPHMCRTFPAVLHSNRAIGFITNPVPTPLSEHHEIYKICPEKWTPEAFSPDPAKVLHTMILTDYEIEFQNKAVEEWNRNPGLAKDFFPYMANSYAGRLRLMPEVVAQPPAVDRPENPTPLPNAVPAGGEPASPPPDRPSDLPIGA